MSLFLPRSKVFFEYVNVPRLSVRAATPDLPGSGSKGRDHDARLGYNMAECGFEGISIKVAKRSSNQGRRRLGQVETETGRTKQLTRFSLSV